jgi:TRAP-type C4-dicarboxylate transport system substrate-binding protein
MYQKGKVLGKRGFLKGAFIAVVALGLTLGIGLFNGKLLYAQSTHIKFSTWHPPAGKEVKTVWIPMLEELKEKSGGQDNISRYAGAALGKGQITSTSLQRLYLIWDILLLQDTRALPTY